MDAQPTCTGHVVGTLRAEGVAIRSFGGAGACCSPVGTFQLRSRNLPRAILAQTLAMWGILPYAAAVDANTGMMGHLRLPERRGRGQPPDSFGFCRPPCFRLGEICIEARRAWQSFAGVDLWEAVGCQGRCRHERVQHGATTARREQTTQRGAQLSQGTLADILGNYFVQGSGLAWQLPGNLR